MLLSKLVSIIQSASKISKDIEVIGLQSSAAQVQKGDVFFAIRGVNKNGADFIPDAVKNGCVAVIADQGVVADVPVIMVKDARVALTEAARVFYPDYHLKKVAVTGTNGKTSTAFFVEQFLNQLGILAGSLGTIGLNSPVLKMSSNSTTPDALTLHKMFHALDQKEVKVLAMEASSHGLEQGRMAGVEFEAAAFTNITRDHLDFHKTMEAYLAAKVKLFTQHVKTGGLAVLNRDVDEFDSIKKMCEENGLKILSYGHQEADLQIVKQAPVQGGQELELKLLGKAVKMLFPVVGEFQVMNCLCAMGLCLGVGADIDKLIAVIPFLKAPVGRMDLAAEMKNGAKVYVDYAHTPDAVERVLISLRAHTKGRLICLLGCGGDRDKGKRPEMGAIADRLADIVYITDDNPRSEDPAVIRAEIKAACPKGVEVGNRFTAIQNAVDRLEENDVLVLLGKGHESGQIIQGVEYVFDDIKVAQLAVLSVEKNPLWSGRELAMALSVEVSERTNAFGVSIDTRTLKLGDLFVAVKGENIDGHQFVQEALAKGAGICIVDHKMPNVFDEHQIVVPDTVKALEALARFARMRSDAVFIGVTGSSGKTTTKEMLRVCLADQGFTYATAGNLNNHFGVPLTLAQIPLEVQYAVIEMGMNHTGEMSALSDLVRPDITVITMVGPAHYEYFKNEQEIATAKAEIFNYQNRYGVAVLNMDNEFYQYLADQATEKGIKNIMTFGEAPKSDFAIQSAIVDGNVTHIGLRSHGSTLSYDIHFVGRHFVMDSAAALAVIDAVGASVPQAMESMKNVIPVAGRGAIIEAVVGGRKISLIDDAYNANPASMKASLNTLGLRNTDGRRIAVLGDMLELGPASGQMHAELAQNVLDNRVDRVYAVGKYMKGLFDVLPVEIQGVWRENPAELIPVLKQELQAGDTVLVKASNGSGLKIVIEGLKG